MPIAVQDGGRNNTVAIPEEVLANGTGRIIITGDNNRIEIAAPFYRLGIHIEMTGHAEIQIERNFNAAHLFMHATAGSVARIGQDVGMNGAVRLLLHEAASIRIGDDCLFGGDVDVTISDMHSIIDIETKVRLNLAKDVRIGNHVWIGQRCLVLKGVDIGSGSVVGAGSVVTRSIPENCVAAGNPAKVIRRGASWNSRLF
ncbi:MAG TPA: acyltransferase [Stellaceae bacterium]|jgi:acetyltransferase-like isoleucine patch superfamily enzyme|nr:acyltransferase [Stellaceae bacterium]